MPQKVNDLLAKNIELLSVETGDAASIDKDRTYHEKKLLIFSDLLRTKNLSQLFSQNHTSVHEHLSKLISESATQLDVLLGTDELTKLTDDIGQTFGLKPKADNSENSKINPTQMAGNGEIQHVDDELLKAKAVLEGIAKADGDQLSALYSLAEMVFNQIGKVISPDIDHIEKFDERQDPEEELGPFISRAYAKELKQFGVYSPKMFHHDPRLYRKIQDVKSYHGVAPVEGVLTKQERALVLIKGQAKALLCNPVFELHKNMSRTAQKPSSKKT